MGCKNKNSKQNIETPTKQDKNCKFKSHLLTLPCNIQRGNILYFCEKHQKVVSLKPITERAKRFILERKTYGLPEGACEDCVETKGYIDEDGVRIFTETEIDNIEVDIQNGKV